MDNSLKKKSPRMSLSQIYFNMQYFTAHSNKLLKPDTEEEAWYSKRNYDHMMTIRKKDFSS